MEAYFYTLQHFSAGQEWININLNFFGVNENTVSVGNLLGWSSRKIAEKYLGIVNKNYSYIRFRVVEYLLTENIFIQIH